MHSKRAEHSDPAQCRPVVAIQQQPRTLGARRYRLPEAHILHPHDNGQTVDQEFTAYTTAALSPQGTDILMFWNVSPFTFKSHPLSLTTSCQPGFTVHVPNHLLNRHELYSNTSLCCAMRAGIFLK